MTATTWIDRLRFGPDGLLPVVTQEATSGDVLMVAWASREALTRTLETGRAHYWSRSRGALWQKGETSGHTQLVDEVRIDCDGDTVLYRVRQQGPACHQGTRTCFSTAVAADGGLASGEDPGAHLVERLARVVHQRATARPEGSYTVRLLDAGVAKVSQKVGEEAVEVVVAANAEDGGRLASEAADLLYHLMVLLEARGVALDAVWDELRRRTT